MGGRRSAKKSYYVHGSLSNSIEKAKATKSNKAIRVYSRGSMVIPDMVGLRFAVHNGKDFIPLLVSESMIGHKFGEFAPTRTYRGHSGDKKTDK